MVPFLFNTTLAYVGSKVYFTTWPMDALCSYNLETGTYEAKIMTEDCHEDVVQYYGGVIRFKDKLIVYPLWGNKFVECDLEGQVQRIVLCEAIDSRLQGAKFQNAVPWGDKVYFIGSGSPVFARYDGTTGKYQILEESLSLPINPGMKGYVLSGVCVLGNLLYVQVMHCSQVVCLDLESERIEVLDWQKNREPYFHIFRDDEYIYQITSNGSLGRYRLTDGKIDSSLVYQGEKLDIIYAACYEDRMFFFGHDSHGRSCWVESDKTGGQWGTPHLLDKYLDRCWNVRLHKDGFLLTGTYGGYAYWYYLDMKTHSVRGRRFELPSMQKKMLTEQYMLAAQRQGRGLKMEEVGGVFALEDFCEKFVSVGRLYEMQTENSLRSVCGLKIYETTTQM